MRLDPLWVRHASWVRAFRNDELPKGFLARCDCGWAGGLYPTMDEAHAEAELHVIRAYQAAPTPEAEK